MRPYTRKGEGKMTDITPNWKEFGHAGVSKSDTRPMISIQASGSIQFNRAAHELLGNPKALKLLYDEENKLIGFRPVSEDEASSYKLHKTVNAERYGFSLKAFANYFGIPLTESRRFEARKFGDVIGIDLSRPDSVSTRGLRNSVT
jgi:hypothetical protein